MSASSTPGRPAPVAVTRAARAGQTSAAPALAATRAATRSRWWGELLVIVFLAWVYDTVANLAPLREKLALAHGNDILSLERSLHLAPEAALNSWLVAHDTLATLLSYYYDNAHFVVTLGLLGWLWWKRADIYRPLRNCLVVINLIGLLVFWLYPVAPPRMLSGFTDVIASSHTFGSWHTGSLAADANQFGAMPSLHIAWAGWCALVLWRLSSRAWLRAVALVYPCLTAFAVLATGNHYVLDLFGGLITFVLAVALVRPMSVAHVTKLLLSRRTGRLAAASEDAL
ncbi:MAG TPA: phosphatase PAP2 family protein [Solirubrobacteraceae bacterium]|nr:phosphatase PAP2 family protein [Solirubrobacteraceae bacterium]